MNTNIDNADLEEVVQLMRTLTMSQIRKQLNNDKRKRPDRVSIVAGFFHDAKEQPK